MTPKRAQALLAAGLTTLAGYVDALGYLQFGGTFVSFMSGNTTRLGAELGGGEPGRVLMITAVIALFLCGVICGHLLRRATPGRNRPAVIGLVTALLVCAGLLHHTGLLILAAGAMTLAMGAENATFEKDGVTSIGLTFVSSTLVKLGDKIADALTGGPAFAWAGPAHRWASLLAGAALGGLAHHTIGFSAVWAATLAAACLTAAAAVWPVGN